MREHETPDPAGSGSQGPPVYPGESIDTDTYGGTESFAGTEAGSGTETVADARDTADPDTTDTTDTTDTAGTAMRADTGSDTADGEGEAPRLLEPADEEDFRTRWSDIQSMFVDDPREAVHAADALVADVMRKLAETFADHKRNLEGQWSEGEDVDTEGLRTALRQYRSFFNRLLTR
ncbi:hypothetical protein ACFY7C_02560 [Streptomyces sp. NPDC012769]|uniref:hypothetical protein n=1 Tax=Streptomyces sp. NPDC012769 TaxID=3364848 RepID=UPI0036D136F4